MLGIMVNPQVYHLPALAALIGLPPDLGWLAEPGVYYVTRIFAPVAASSFSTLRYMRVRACRYTSLPLNHTHTGNVRDLSFFPKVPSWTYQVIFASVL
jgi:hypothetical protein